MATGVGFGPSGQVTLPQNASKNDHPSLRQTFHNDDQGAFGVSTLMVVQVPGNMDMIRGFRETRFV